jgi:hypothetical protein
MLGHRYRLNAGFNGRHERAAIYCFAPRAGRWLILFMTSADLVDLGIAEGREAELARRLLYR